MAEAQGSLNRINQVTLCFKYQYTCSSQMKIHPFGKDNNVAKAAPKFVCKECKMVFQSKDSLELHKRKSRHFSGLIYFGKSDK